MTKTVLLILSLFMVSSAWANDFNTDRCYVECDQMLMIYRHSLLKQVEKKRKEYKQQLAGARLVSENAEGQIVEGLAYFLGYGDLLSKLRRVESLANKAWNEPLNSKEDRALSYLCHNGWDVGRYAVSKQ